MDIQTFWKIIEFVHFALAVALLAAVTIQSFAVLVPARQAVGAMQNAMQKMTTLPLSSYATLIVLLYVPQALMGAWVYVKYRTYVRIPMEGYRHWWTVGSFEFKEHVVTMGLALLPAYWYFWREPLSEEHAATRKWLTLFIAFTVWYSFAVGHVANDFRGVGS
jgi:heme A synthase